MTREETKELLPIMQAYAEGKPIQYRAIDGGYWYDLEGGRDVDWDANEYRIKPVPKYRPFRDAEECWAEMLKHQPFGWLRMDICSTYDYHSIDFLDKCGIISRNGHSNDFEELFYSQTFADGTPFGIKEGGEK